MTPTLTPDEMRADAPFDPRTEVSADAHRIVLNLWIILVGIPLVIGILYAFAHA